MNRRWRQRVTACGVLLSPLSGEAQHLDILVVRHQDQLVTGSFDFGTAEARLPVRVFSRSFEFVWPDRSSGNDPGFNAINSPPAPYAPLPVGEAVLVGVRVSALVSTNLAYFSGEGSPAITEPPAGERFTIALAGVLGPIAELTIAGDAEPVNGFVFATTDAFGALHQHLDYTLLARDGQPPTPGVYVVPLVLGLGAMESDVVYLLMTHDTDELAASSLQAYIEERLHEQIDANRMPDASAESVTNASERPRDGGITSARDGAAVTGESSQTAEALSASRSVTGCGMGQRGGRLGSLSLLALACLLARSRRQPAQRARTPSPPRMNE